MTGRVFNIQRFSLHDGPGIRTTVFLMGCSLSCRWCHNPEGKSSTFQLQYDAKNCISCGSCAAVCQHRVHILTDRNHRVCFEQCVRCGACVEVCPSRALSFSGREYDARELSARLIRDIPFYGDTGGVTFSGGEPLLQPEFAAQTAQLCREAGVKSVAVDTAGLVSRKSFEIMLPHTDLFLYDLKAASEDVHIAGTGVSNALILENLRWLDTQGKRIFIRVPVIPGINDRNTELEKIAAIAGELRSLEELRLIPYHTFGREKYGTLGLPAPERFCSPDPERIADLQYTISCFLQK